MTYKSEARKRARQLKSLPFVLRHKVAKRLVRGDLSGARALVVDAGGALRGVSEWQGDLLALTSQVWFGGQHVQQLDAWDVLGG